MKIGEFIQKHMNEKQINQAELARRSGVPASTISSIINRNNDRVAIEMMLKLCEVLECDIEEYINSLKKEQTKQMPSLFAKKYYSLDDYGRKTVNVVLDYEYERCTYIKEPEDEEPTFEICFSELPVSAGTGEFLSEEMTSIIEIPDTPFNRTADFVVQVSGRSMEPEFYEDDLLLVRKQPSVYEGEIGIFVKNGCGYVKKFGGDRLISINPDYDDIDFGEYDTVVCYGKVIGKV